MIVQAKRGLIYNQNVYKQGETFQMLADDYAFNWLKKGWVVEVGKAEAVKPEDDLVATEALPTLEEETKRKGKKNV